MRTIKITLIFISIFWCGLTQACGLTPEYVEARGNIHLKANKNYSSCVDAAKNHAYWKLFARCRGDGAGKEVAGGCEHVVGYRVGSIAKVESAHCEILKPSKESLQKLLDEIVFEKNINKCTEKP